MEFFSVQFDSRLSLNLQIHPNRHDYDSQLPGREFLERQKKFPCSSTVAGHTAVALQNARHFNEAQTRELKDQLTGLESPQFFEERLAVEMRNANQQNYPLCLGLLYVNDFQDIVMTQGQTAAETVLHKVGFLVKTHVRKGSVVGRTGNEEFGMILPNVPKERAQQIMNNIKQIVENTITTDSGKPVTVGIGVIEATLSPTLWTTQSLNEAETTKSPGAFDSSNGTAPPSVAISQRLSCSMFSRSWLTGERVGNWS